MATLAENPLSEGLERLPVHPTTFVIFGATGDLSRRKLLPAVYNLAHDGALPERLHLIGFSRSAMSDEEFRGQAEEAIREHSRREVDEGVLGKLLGDVRYVSGSFDDPEAFGRLDAVAGEFDEHMGTPLNRAYYLSTSPSFFPVVAEQLGARGMHQREGAEVRLIVEKPM